MKIRIAATLVASLAASAGGAVASDPIAEIAAGTGLRVREVKMLAGAPSAWAEYRTSYLRAKQAARGAGLDARALALIERQRREIDRAVEISMRYSVLPRPAPTLIVSRD